MAANVVQLLLLANTIPFIKGLGGARIAAKALGGSLIALTTAVVGLSVIAKTTRDFAKFEKELKFVSTLGDISANSMNNMKGAALALSSEVNQFPTELVKGFYQAISRGATSASQAIETTRVAAMLATAGFTDTNTAVKVLRAAINQYGLAAIDAEKVSDQLFVTLQKGGIDSINELAVSLGKALPSAKAAGVRLAEVNAGIAVLTQGGFTAEESVTALRNTFLAFVKGADKFRDAGIGVLKVISEDGLLGGLAALRELTGGNIEKVQEFIPNIRSLQAVLGLTGEQFDAFVKTLGDVENASGETKEAFDKQMDSLVAQSKRAGVALTTFSTIIGEPFANALKGGMSNIANFVESLNGLIRAEENLITQARGFAEEGGVFGELFKITKAESALRIIEDFKKGLAAASGKTLFSASSKQAKALNDELPIILKSLFTILNMPRFEFEKQFGKGAEGLKEFIKQTKEAAEATKKQAEEAKNALADENNKRKEALAEKIRTEKATNEAIEAIRQASADKGFFIDKEFFDNVTEARKTFEEDQKQAVKDADEFLKNILDRRSEDVQRKAKEKKDFLLKIEKEISAGMKEEIAERSRLLKITNEARTNAEDASVRAADENSKRFLSILAAQGEEARKIWADQFRNRDETVISSLAKELEHGDVFFANSLNSRQEFWDSVDELDKKATETFQETLTEWLGSYQTLQDGMKQLTSDTFSNFRDTFADAVGDLVTSFGDMDNAAKAFGNVMRALGKEIASSIISALVKIGIQQAFQFALGAGLAKARVAVTIAEAAATTAAWTVPAGLVSLGTAGANSIGALAGIKAVFGLLGTISTASSIFGAGSAGAGGAGNVSSTGAQFTPGFDQGITFVPKRGLSMLDTGERVLSRDLNKDLTNFIENASNRGGGTTIIKELIVFKDPVLDQAFLNMSDENMIRLVKKKILPALNEVGERGGTTSLRFKSNR